MHQPQSRHTWRVLHQLGLSNFSIPKFMGMLKNFSLKTLWNMRHSWTGGVLRLWLEIFGLRPETLWTAFMWHQDEHYWTLPSGTRHRAHFATPCLKVLVIREYHRVSMCIPCHARCPTLKIEHIGMKTVGHVQNFYGLAAAVSSKTSWSRSGKPTPFGCHPHPPPHPPRHGRWTRQSWWSGWSRWGSPIAANGRWRSSGSLWWRSWKSGASTRTSPWGPATSAWRSWRRSAPTRG